MNQNLYKLELIFIHNCKIAILDENDDLSSDYERHFGKHPGHTCLCEKELKRRERN